MTSVHDLDDIAVARGPVRPGPGTAAALRPLDGSAVRLDQGLLHDWQARNRAASLPLALRQLESAGNLANLRLAIAGARDGYRGPVFMDSDLYKTLEAIGWELGRDDDAELARFLDEATELLARAQQPDGYLISAIVVTGRARYATLSSSHELYCAGHLIQAAIACHRGAGRSGLLAVARRFADHLVDHFLGRQAGVDGHPVVESALAELYRETGHAPYLELASQFIEQRGHGLIGDSGFGHRYLQDHQPVRESETEVGHVVRALYLEAGIADVAAETGDAGLLATALRRWDDMVATKTYLTGGNGSRHEGESFGDRYELPPDRAYNETCAAIASFQWSWRLLLATGDSRYADLMERVLYNGFAASTGTEGTRFFYVNPLQRRADHYEKDDPGRRREWFSCACCPPNIMRLAASLQHYLATVAGRPGDLAPADAGPGDPGPGDGRPGDGRPGDGPPGDGGTLYVHHFTGAVLTAPLAGGVLAVHMTTDYPWSGTVRLRVTGAPPQDCGLALRVPSWDRGPRLMLNDAPAQAAREAGYLVLRRGWRPGDELRYELDVSPRLSHPGRRVDAVRGMAAIERGPLVYCFEQADQPAGTDLEDLAIQPGGLREREADLPGVGRTVLIEAAAVWQPPASADGLPYGAGPGEAGTPERPFGREGTAGDGQPERPAPAGAAGEPVTVTALPYFQWDNRDGQAMRVWLPAGPTAPPAG